MMQGLVIASGSSVATGPHRSPPDGGSVRDALRDATRDAHERLHRHPGFLAVAEGTVGMADYRRLLGRLYGFHAPLDRRAGWDGWRVGSLRDDLLAVGANPDGIDALPLCNDLPDLSGPEARTGAAYVVEGSALGGRVLAAALRPLLGDGDGGRRFFLGVGGRPGAWRACLQEIERLGQDPVGRQAVVAGARDTFVAIEAWLAGWKADHD